LCGTSVESNQLTELPKEIGFLKKLESLFLGANQLTKLPNEMGYLKNLKRLYLSRFRIKGMILMINWQELDSIDNPLKQLPKEFENLTELCIFTHK